MYVFDPGEIRPSSDRPYSDLAGSCRPEADTTEDGEVNDPSAKPDRMQNQQSRPPRICSRRLQLPQPSSFVEIYRERPTKKADAVLKPI